MHKTDTKVRNTAVLIHGLSEQREVWSRQARHLSRTMNVVAYDVRGFGSSPVGAGDGTVAQMADDLAQILSAQAVESAWLVGFSMGGVIAQRFALDFPGMVQGLVLIASSCKVGRVGQEFFHHRIETASTGGLEALARLNLDDARGCLSTGNEELVAEYQRLRTGAVRDVNGYLNACHAMLRLADEPMTEELGGIDCPTLVLTGDLDPYCPPKASEMIADPIPGAELRIVPGAGHCVHWEAEEKTNEILGEFIDGPR